MQWESSSPQKSEMWESSITIFHGTLVSLDKLWKQIGFNRDQLDERRKAFHKHLAKVLNYLIKEEEDVRDSLLKRIESDTKEVEHICHELGMAPDEKALSIDSELPLLEKKACVSSKLNELKEEKHNREMKLSYLRGQEHQFCKALDVPPMKFKSDPTFPSSENISELEEYIKLLEAEKGLRLKEMTSIKTKLTAIMEEIEYLPETSFGTSVIYSNDESIILSKKNLEEMRLLVKKADHVKLEMEEEFASLKEKLENLWTRLRVDEEQRQQFLAEHMGCKMSVITAFQREIRRLEEVRKQNMANYVSQMRIELINLWDKCYVSQNEREKCVYFSDDNFTEELLDLHDDEVLRLKSFYKDNEHIFVKIQKRHQLWDRMIEFDKKSNDPNRYTNRGGGLLQEEKERNRLIKELPRLEAEILEAIQKYEESTGREFLIKGQRFGQYIENQRIRLMEEREKEKVERKQRATLVDVSTNRSTVMHGKRQLGTPTGTPSKFRRMNSETTMFRTPGCMSRTNSSVHPKSAGPKTPKSQPKIFGRPAPKTTPRRKTALRQDAPVTRDENHLLRPTSVSRQVLFEPNIASYMEFSEELNSKSKANCRSSCKYPLRNLQSSSNTRVQPKLKEKLGLPLLL